MMTGDLCTYIQRKMAWIHHESKCEITRDAGGEGADVNQHQTDLALFIISMIVDYCTHESRSRSRSALICCRVKLQIQFSE